MKTLEQTLIQLAEISRLLDQATSDLAIADNESVDAKVDYIKEYAYAFMNSTGSMDLRRYTADLETISTLRDKEIGEAKVRAIRERLRTLRDQMEILRTTAAGQRVQFMAEPTGQWS